MKLMMTLVLAVLGLAMQCTLAADAAALTEKDDGTTVSLAIGATLVVHLVGNPSTGFEWSDAGTKGTAVKVVSMQYQRGANQPGAPGMYIITVKSVAAGTGEIHLEYKRSWEKKTPPAKTFILTVQVK